MKSQIDKVQNSDFFATKFFVLSCPLAPQKWKISLCFPSPSMDAERDCQLPGQLVEWIMDGFIAIVAQALK